MSHKIPEQLRRIVWSRANNCCEYCRLPAADSFYGFHIDHIKSRKHGGLTVLENLACSCPDCNRNKGTDLGTFPQGDQQLIRFFNPRIDNWEEHFDLLQNGQVNSKTDVGAATILIFQINHPDRIIERSLLIKLGIMA